MQLKNIHPLDIPIEIFAADLTKRASNIVKAEVMWFEKENPTVRHLMMFSRKEIRKWPNLGKKSLNDIEEHLRNIGLQLWKEHDERSLKLLREHEIYVSKQQEHAEELAKLNWQYFECPACGSEGARAFPDTKRNWIGLMDDEIEKCCYETDQNVADSTMTWKWTKMFAVAIEQMLRKRTMDIDLEKCFAFVQTEASNLGKAEGEVIRLEGKLKAVKAALMEASDASSAAMKDVDSLRHPAYLEAVQELADATQKKVYLGIMIKAAFQKIECWRAQSYVTKQELRNL